MNAIEVRDLARSFGAVRAVDGVSFAVRRGEIFGLVGPDGAGKTTTVRLLCGLLDADAGEARVAGFDAARQTTEVRDRIGYMAQRFGLYQDLTVEENMVFYADLFGVVGAERDRLMAELLRMTRMEPFRARPAGKLSGGMKQKLALMCTLLHHPEILFLDEPTNGVDPVSRRDFWRILYQLVHDGLTVLVTTAYLDEAERCNRVGLLHRGKLIHCDTPRALRESLPGACYEVTGPDLRAARARLAAAPGVTGVEPAGGSLHLFLSAGAAPPAAGDLQFREILPSLEDVFIALVRRAEAA